MDNFGVYEIAPSGRAHKVPWSGPATAS